MPSNLKHAELESSGRIVSSTERGRITLIFVAVKSARLVMDLALSLSTMMAADLVLAVAVSP